MFETTLCLHVLCSIAVDRTTTTAIRSKVVEVVEMAVEVVEDA
jgi:hypothetical protein